MVAARAITHIYSMYSSTDERGQNEGVETLPDPVVGPDSRNRHRRKAGLTAMFPRTGYIPRKRVDRVDARRHTT